MSRNTVYLVDPDWEGDPEDHDQAVVETWDDTYDQFAVAEELWRLLGDAPRAARIDDVLSRAVARAYTNLQPDEIRELLRLIDGLEASVRDAGHVDQRGQLVLERLSELRRHKCYRLDFSDANPRLHYVLEDAMIGILRLRYVLSRALDLGLDIALP